MKRIRNWFLLVAGASALAACASHGPASPSATAPASGSAAAVAGAAAPTAAKPVPNGYKRVVKHGDEYFCKWQAVTGSHTLKTEVCLTQAELDAEKNHSVSIGVNPAASAAR